MDSVGSPYGPSASQSTFGGGGGSGGGGPSNASSSSGFVSGTAAAEYRLRASQFRSFMGSTHPFPGSAAVETFTPQMRDRQARGKDPYTSGNSSDESDPLNGNDLRFGSAASRDPKEDFAKAERRQTAISYLDSPELLMIWAQSTGDSIAGARQHWMKVLCGYEDEPADSKGKHHHQQQHSPFQYRSRHHQPFHQHHHQHTQRRRAGPTSHQYYEDDL
ncbi:hypothetical protein QBC43DRAFT_286997 [Cladorrhinum sp. PSN259]|nr:hypothetical protein QBC43DRAFT_286997 [Cladorrhinum sp. PSN259]